MLTYPERALRDGPTPVGYERSSSRLPQNPKNRDVPTHLSSRREVAILIPWGDGGLDKFVTRGMDSLAPASDATPVSAAETGDDLFDGLPGGRSGSS